MIRPTRALTRARIALLAAIAFLIAASTVPLGPLGAWPAHAAAPSGLPNHLGIGLSGGPTAGGIYGWMPDSGVPWDYAYQYLVGGVNTGGGWETWNTNGQFATWYAQGAASHGYIPVLSYYELQQSNGSCGSCGETQKDLSNLNNPGTMASYYQNFALLMKRLGTGTYDGIAGFGKTAIVHVEPDLSGFAEQAVLDNTRCSGYCTGQGNDPALLKAAVKGSSDPDVAAYPDTYQGFNQALLHLRDLYAPNVLLAAHVSNWATSKDIGGPDQSLDATALGQEAGAFVAASGITGPPAGARGYDLLFNDVADRDAGYIKANWGVDTWWDARNVAVPNFHRWEDYIGAASQAAGRSVMVWQIPLGNQYFDTENNTNGHYQDNRAEYFFGHMDELARAGVIGLLFGAGNGGSTVNIDVMNDSVTNPASFCTGAGASSGQVCNTHTSTVSDDDGGYLRMAAGQYYASGAYPLGGSTSPAASTATPQPPTATPQPPTATPQPPTATNTATPTNTATNTATSAPAATNTPRATATATATNTAVPTTTATARPSATNTPTNTRVPSATAAAVSTATTVSTATDTPRPANMATSTPPVIPPASTATSTSWGNTETNTPAPGATATAPDLPSTGTATATTRPAATATNTVPSATATRLPRTATPTSTRTSAPLTFSFGRTTKSSVTVLPGTTQVFTTTIASNNPTSNELVDFEVHDPQDHLIWQTWRSPVSFNAGMRRAFTVAWSVARTAAAGTYTFKIGVFTADWSRLQAWNNSAITCLIPRTDALLARPVNGARLHVVTLRPRAHLVTLPAQLRSARGRPTRRQAKHRVGHPTPPHVHGHDKRQGVHR